MKLNTQKKLVVAASALVMCGLAPFMHDFFIASAFAQAPEAAAAEVSQGAPTTLGDYWKAAGITRWPLLGIAVWITAVVIELSLRARTKTTCPPDAVSQLSSTLAVQDHVKAWQFCADNPSPLTRVMMPSIEILPKGLNAVTDATFEVINLQNNNFKTKCSYLNLHATVSTLLGLFGTITGMMGAFNKMAYAGAAGDPAKLAGSISEALVTTWIGLGMGITALALFYVFTNRIKAVMTAMQNVITSLISEIDFNAITPDMEIITGEMKARALGAKALAEPGRQAKAAPSAPGGKAAEMAQCPHCQHAVQAGAAKCPNCNSELEWE